ncbi:MAG: hypothetical protein HYT37_03490 [Candidatus Sungbacteria bacterium]|nr:hypothetical protein [Candidatus Sungbacteria bacterium]
MPEHAPQHFEQASEKITLSFEDRDRLDRLFGDIGDNSLDHPTSEEETLIYAWRNMLKEENGKAAVYLLEKIESAIASAGMESNMWLALKQLLYCASGHHSKRIATILLHDKVSLNYDRSNKISALTLLQHIGTPEVIEDILRFAEKTTRAQYRWSTYENDDPTRLIRYDHTEALQAILGILLRTKNQNSGNASAIARINYSLATFGGNSISDEEKNNLQSYAVSDQQRFAERFTAPVFSHREDTNIREHQETHTEDMMYRDNEEDDREIANDYDTHNFKEVESRLETVKRLRHEIKKERATKEEPEEDGSKFLRRHFLEYREENPSPLTPTLGIEIEIREKSVFSGEELKKLHGTDEDWNIDIYEKKKDKYKKTVAMGIPYGYDKFWEFAHKPVKNYLTLSREVQALIEMGLINKEYAKHPLHMTIGWISKEAKGGGDVFLLARALEATGWSTTGGRLLRPYKASANGWNVKGEGGVMERYSQEIDLDVPYAVEIRTFQLQSLAGLDRMLRSAFFLGAALRAHLETKNSGKFFTQNAINTVEGLAIEKLAEVWESFAIECSRLFDKFQLKHPDEIWPAPNKFDDTYKQNTNPFVPFAALLDEAKDDPQKSQGADFVKKIRALVIEHRTKVKEIIYPR